MAQIPAQRAPSPLLRINNFAGINKAATPTQIGDNESPDMLNVQLDEIAAMDKRPGYARVFPTSLGPGKINGLYQFKQTSGAKIFLIHHNTTLYTQTGNAQPVSVFSGMANGRSRFFTFNNKCYIMDGTNYLVYDGSIVVQVSTVAYVPTLRISSPPAGGGPPNDDFNLLTPAFKVSFSGDGTAKDFTLGVTSLDATPLTATVNGTAMNEGAGFTVNRTTGVVTFTTAPTTGVPNNVVITAYKTSAGFADRIKKCRFFVIYGGTNDTRVHVAGNPALPNTQWRSGVSDPTYFGENKFQKVGSDASAITGYAKQYNSCVIMKEPAPNDTVIWNMNYQLAADGLTVSFPVTPLNDEIGCSATDSIQMVENSPMYLNASKGVYVVVGSNVRDERNVQHVSKNIDPLLLLEPGLTGAVSVDYDKKYILIVGTKGYVYDYRQQVWYLWDNIPASCFLEMDGALYFGSNSEGLVYRFAKGKDDEGNVISNAFNDDGGAITGRWASKVFSLGSDEHLKMAEKVFFSLKPASATSASLYYQTDREAKTFATTARMDLFDFTTFDFSFLSFILSSVAQEIAEKIKAKKIIYFQIFLENNRVNESMGILSIGIKFHTQREVK